MRPEGNRSLESAALQRCRFAFNAPACPRPAILDRPEWFPEPELPDVYRRRFRRFHPAGFRSRATDDRAILVRAVVAPPHRNAVEVGFEAFPIRGTHGDQDISARSQKHVDGAEKRFVRFSRQVEDREERNNRIDLILAADSPRTSSAAKVAPGTLARASSICFSETSGPITRNPRCTRWRSIGMPAP